MHNEIAKGEKPALTNLAGASAAPNQTPAERPQITPIPWSEPDRRWTSTALLAMLDFLLLRNGEEFSAETPEAGRQPPGRRPEPKTGRQSGLL
jgi:hypothetical protein